MGIVWQFYSKDRFPFWCPFWGIVLFLKRKDRFEIFKTENDWKIVFKNYITIFKIKTENEKNSFSSQNGNPKIRVPF